MSNEEKHEYWMYRFDGAVYAEGPIDLGKPVTKKQILKVIKKRFETTKNITVWATTPWWREE